MAIVDLVMPKLGESIMEATILKWHKQPGDAVKMDETVLEIATDKVDSEVPSTAEGTVQELLFNVNDVVPIGTVIARISTSAEAPHVAPIQAPQTPKETFQPAVESAGSEYINNTYTQPAQNTIAAAQHYKPTTTGNRFYSPLV